jgi:hypothetical protein
MKRLSYEELAAQNAALADMTGKLLGLISTLPMLSAELKEKCKVVQIAVAHIQVLSVLNAAASAKETVK